MELQALAGLISNNTVITENERIRLLQFFQRTMNMDEQDLKMIEKNSVLFVIQAYSSGPNRAKKIWDSLLNKLKDYDKRIFDANKVMLIYRHSSQYFPSVAEGSLLYGNLSVLLHDEIKLSKMSWIIDENLNDDLELTLILASPIQL
jgi:hypothetical protein